jgi:hypothetical protein
VDDRWRDDNAVDIPPRQSAHRTRVQGGLTVAGETHNDLDELTPLTRLALPRDRSAIAGVARLAGRAFAAFRLRSQTRWVDQERA